MHQVGEVLGDVHFLFFGSLVGGGRTKRPIYCVVYFKLTQVLNYTA